MSTLTGGSQLFALSGPDESLAQASGPGANGKIAFTRALNIQEVRVMNADGSNQVNLTNSQGFDGRPVWSPDGTRIAFESGRDSNQEIYVMNAVGGNATRLTNDPANDSSPAWSHDGARIAFTRSRTGPFFTPTSVIYVMNADGSNQTQLTFPSFWDLSDYSPAWSPDGSRIAFSRGGQIYLINADGGNPTQLTNSQNATNYDPDWSPDGARIAFNSSRDGDTEIYVMNADGGNQARLTNGAANGFSPAWSPDGTKIAFASSRDSYHEIYVMRADGSNQTRITNSLASDREPDWSPDGSMIAYWTWQYFTPEIYAMNADGSSQMNLTNHPANDNGPAWSPNGSRIAFASDRDGNNEIYVMNADGSNPTRLTSRSGPDIDPDWSPDGTRIVFTGSDGIYVMNADGSNQTRLINLGFYGSGTPAWSPDGSVIAITHNGEIWVVTANGGNTTRLTMSTLLEAQVQPAWSPDGTRISYTTIPIYSDQWTWDDEIVVMNADGGNNVNLTNTPGVVDAGSAWSPDGARIAFASYRDGNNEIYVMNADGGNPTRLTHNLDASNQEPDWQVLPATPINPIDDAQLFVRQHYLDFLNREPDPGGLAYWTDRITQCGSDARCIHERRIGVSAAFFIELEFQDTGYYVYRFYRASFGRQPNYAEFNADRSRVVDGPSLEANKQAFADEWVQRPAFVIAYPITMSNTEFVNELFDTAGLTASIYDPQRQQEIAAMNSGRSRALVLRDVIEIPDFKNTPDPNSPRYSEIKQVSQYNPAFVLMQYFGYLRRNIDQDGYDHWLDVLDNLAPNDYHAMVCAFLTSSEYQLRFGASVTRTNQDCGP